jgi:hypothetical protein
MEKLVEKSTRQYHTIRELQSEMALLLQEGQTAALVRVQQQWQSLNAEAQKTDRQINTLMQGSQPADQLLAAMKKKQQIMLQVQQQCETMLQQARTLQALTGDELTRLKQGRKAMDGYRASNQGEGHATLGSC